LAERQLAVLAVGGCPHQPWIDPRETTDVAHARPDAVEPRALVRSPWSGEGGTGELLGVEAVVDLLGRVAADRQRARQRLRLEAVAEPRLIALRHPRSPPATPDQAGCMMALDDMARGDEASTAAWPSPASHDRARSTTESG